MAISCSAGLLSGNRVRSKVWSAAALLACRVAVLLAILTTAQPALACGEAFSRCVSLETLLTPTTPSRFASMHSWEASERTRVFLQATYQHRPLVVVASSPDPFGREVPILSDWLNTTLGADARVAWLRLGVSAPLAIRLAGTGRDGIASTRADSGITLALGDPEVMLSTPFAFGGFRGGVIQRLTVPLGSNDGFAAHHGPRYAPVLSFSRALGTTLIALEVGARLRRSERFGDVRFGSEASGQLGVSHEFGPGFSMSVEGLVHPALSRDESRTADGTTIRIRRVPAELLLSAQLGGKNERLVLGAGTSLPLSERVAGNERETFAGPPGAPIFVTMRVDHVF